MRYTTYKPNEIPRLKRPIVYGWRRHDQYLYIGKSKKGTERIINGTTIKFHLEPEDVIDIWKTNLKNTDSTEIHLIRKYNPKYNIVYTVNPCSFDTEGNQICTSCKTRIRAHSNQRFCSSICRTKYWKEQETPNSEKMKKYKKLLKEIDKLFPKS